jgi:hypothetical protein
VSGLPLICAPGNRRPTHTDAMRLEAAQQLVERLIKSGILPPQEIDGAAEDIAKATRYEWSDGYKMAKELEDRHHWDCDMQIAEALEEFEPILERIYSAAEQQWATENPRDPVYPDGASVTWRGKPATVVGVDVRRPQCYHLRQAAMRPGSYYVVPFEDVTDAADEVRS